MKHILTEKTIKTPRILNDDGGLDVELDFDKAKLDIVFLCNLYTVTLEDNYLSIAENGYYRAENSILIECDSYCDNSINVEYNNDIENYKIVFIKTLDSKIDLYLEIDTTINEFLFIKHLCKIHSKSNKIKITKMLYVFLQNVGLIDVNELSLYLPKI